MFYMIYKVGAYCTFKKIERILDITYYRFLCSYKCNNKLIINKRWLYIYISNNCKYTKICPYYKNNECEIINLAKHYFNIVLEDSDNRK